MAKNKTVATDGDVTAFLDAHPHEGRREDAWALLALMEEVTGEPAVMWGPGIIGFGSYHYRYDSGREGDFLRIGFAPRKTNLALYLMPGVEAFPELLAQLGPYKNGKSCLYITRLGRVDADVLRSLVKAAWDVMAERYPD